MLGIYLKIDFLSHPIHKYRIKLYYFETSSVHLPLYLEALFVLILLEPWHFVNGPMVFPCTEVPRHVFSHLDIQVVSHLFLLQTQLQ